MTCANYMIFKLQCSPLKFYWHLLIYRSHVAAFTCQYSAEQRYHMPAKSKICII